MKKLLVILLLSYLALFDFTSHTMETNALPLKANEPSSSGIDDTTSFEALPLNTESQFNNIVIFIRFQDESTYQSPYSLSEYDEIFNGVDQVSLRDYYLEVSYNQLTIDSYFTESNNEILYIDDTYPRDYYRPYDEVSNTMGYQNSTEERDREHALLKRSIDYVDAYQLLDTMVELDTNNDNIVDSVTFMVSGEDDGWNELLWPHKWELSSYYDYGTDTFDYNAPTLYGYNVLDYTFNLMGNTRDYTYKASVGILAHETFHLLSGKDLYHYYQYDYIDNVGSWGLMDDTSTPPSHMLGYMKEYYGQWIPTVNEITENGQYILYPVQDSPANLYRIDTGYSNEYVYLEYRDLDGLYESMLPSSGLITYRVDQDYAGDGNVDGYYSNGTAINEVFLFRPGILDTTEPITFPSDTENEDYDGYPSLAGLSNFNTYNAAGLNHDILFFHSDGFLMDMELFNVREEHGYVVFDLFLEQPSINLVTSEELTEETDIRLLNNDIMDYRFKVSGLGTYTAYYTLDGSIPTTNSEVYSGPVSFNNLSNQITVSIYEGARHIRTIEETYTFVDTIESNHNGYGNNQNITWVLEPTASVGEMSLLFSDLSYTRTSGDYVRITNNGVTTTYATTELSNLSITELTNTVLIQFITDATLEDYYGFSLDFNYEYVPIFSMFGEEYMTLDLNEPYIEQEGEINSFYEGQYYYQTEGTIDNTVIGEQYIYYNVYDLDNVLVETYIRTVEVVDTTPPTISLIGDKTVYVEVYTKFDDPGVEASDNYSDTVDVEVTGNVDLTTLGTYELTYTATDSSGNTSSIIRTIIVEDTTPPEITILGDKTVYVEVYDSYTDEGALVSDNYDDSPSLTVENNVDTSTVGTYLITYTSTDQFGNTEVVTRTVHIIDVTPPEVTLLPGVDTIYVNDEHVDAGVSVDDNYYDNPEVHITSTIDNTTPGTYTIVYEVVDQSGNITSLTRYVTVLEEQSPIVFEFTDGQVGYYLNEELNLPDCQVRDTTCTVDENINTSVNGLYTVTYTVTIDGQTYIKEIPILVYDKGLTVAGHIKKKRGLFL